MIVYPDSLSTISACCPSHLTFPPREAICLPSLFISTISSWNWESLVVHEFIAVLEISINFHWNKPDQARRPLKRLPYRVHPGTSAFLYNDGFSAYRDTSNKYTTAMKTVFVMGTPILIRCHLFIDTALRYSFRIRDFIRKIVFALFWH